MRRPGALYKSACYQSFGSCPKLLSCLQIDMDITFSSETKRLKSRKLNQYFLPLVLICKTSRPKWLFHDLCTDICQAAPWYFQLHSLFTFTYFAPMVVQLAPALKRWQNNFHVFCTNNGAARASSYNNASSLKQTNFAFTSFAPILAMLRQGLFARFHGTCTGDCISWRCSPAETNKNGKYS